jgi:hypothetical protein
MALDLSMHHPDALLAANFEQVIKFVGAPERMKLGTSMSLLAVWIFLPVTRDALQLYPDFA